MIMFNKVLNILLCIKVKHYIQLDYLIDPALPSLEMCQRLGFEIVIQKLVPNGEQMSGVGKRCIACGTWSKT